MDGNEEKLIIGLETGLNGGCVSICRNGKQIDFSEGSGGVSKSEDMLLAINFLLEKNGIRKREISGIAVSDGPGSLTGIRIGLAIAKGLGDALGAQVRQCSILEALARPGNKRGRVMAGLVTRNDSVYLREYQFVDGKISGAGEVVVLKHASDVAAVIDESDGARAQIILHEDLAKIYRQQSARVALEVKGNFAQILASRMF